MFNPEFIYCRKDRWKKVATSVTEFILWKADKDPGLYLISYRMTGDTGPFLQTEGMSIFVNLSYFHAKFSDKIDVYVMAVGSRGRVRIDILYNDLLNAQIDSVSRAITTIDANHREIHEGCHYFYNRDTILANVATGDWVLELTTKDLHFVYSIGSDTAGFTFSTIEDITADSNGTLLEINNSKRRAGDNSTAILRYNPTNVVTAGKRIMRSGTFGTATNPAKSSAGSVVRSDEVILQAGKKYLLRVTNLSTGNNPVNVAMSWYEEEV